MNPLSRTRFHSPPLPSIRLLGQAPTVQGWQSSEQGRVAASPTKQHPGRVRLRNTKAQWSRFVATELPTSTVLRIHAQSQGDFRITVEVATSAGPRTFVFVSMGGRTFRLGSRYMVGLGRIFSPTQPGSTNVDLAAVARTLEPRVRVKAVTAMSVGAASSMFVEVVDQQNSSDPTPLPPVPLPQGPVPQDLAPPAQASANQEKGPVGTALDSTPDPTGLDPQEQNERRGAADPPDRQIVQPPAVNITAQDAFRFLTQASFGATHQTLTELMQLNSYSDWIQRQLAMPPSLTEPYTVANSDGCDRATRHYVWWDNVMDGPDQLRQRLAFAWSQIFVVSDWDYPLKKNQYAMSNYYDMLATACTGNFRSMLEKVTLHPAMGVYLSMVRNEKADPARNIRPDENFAREVLQLFTIGLHQLSPDGQVIHQDGRPVPSYDQRTIEEFAKVFTGWNFADANHWIAGDVPTFDLRLPMSAWEQHHEQAAKELLGTTVAPGGTAAEDLGAALDTIFAHPNVGPFLARLLIQRLVTSNPTPAYVGRVAAVFANDGTGVRGNLQAVSHAILLDPEARGGHRSLRIVSAS